MNGTPTERVFRVWEGAIGGLATVIVVTVVASCLYLFVAPSDTSGAAPPPVDPMGMDMDMDHGAHTEAPATVTHHHHHPPANDSVHAISDATYGMILVAADGHALYRFDADPPDHVTCTGGCATTWMPATVTGKPTAGPGVVGEMLGTILTERGEHQLTYAQHPLYRYVGDVEPADRYGQGSFGAWWLVGTAGQEISAAKANPAKSAPKAGY